MNDLQVKNNKHNYKLSDNDKRLIIIDYTLNRTNDNIFNICNRYNISKQTLYNIINKYTKEERYNLVDTSIKEYRKNFTKKANNLIEKALNKLDNQLNNEEESVNINQLTTMIGILYDKTRLEDNLSTSNNSFNININIDKQTSTRQALAEQGREC